MLLPDADTVLDIDAFMAEVLDVLDDIETGLAQPTVQSINPLPPSCRWLEPQPIKHHAPVPLALVLGRPA